MEQLAHRAVGIALPSRRGLASVVLRFIRSKPLGAVGAVLVIAVVAAALAAPVIARYDPIKMHFDAPLQGPSFRFWLGTDQN
ncbi:MAG: hypothetical protein HY680_11730, partial [Chloroflexi bacterium]|nr:hypothetical protein [Chloroflexota bacterium]